MVGGTCQSKIHVDGRFHSLGLDWSPNFVKQYSRYYTLHWKNVTHARFWCSHCGYIGFLWLLQVLPVVQNQITGSSKGWTPHLTLQLLEQAPNQLKNELNKQRNKVSDWSWLLFTCAFSWRTYAIVAVYFKWWMRGTFTMSPLSFTKNPFFCLSLNLNFHWPATHEHTNCNTLNWAQSLLYTDSDVYWPLNDTAFRRISWAFGDTSLIIFVILPLVLFATQLLIMRVLSSLDSRSSIGSAP